MALVMVVAPSLAAVDLFAQEEAEAARTEAHKNKFVGVEGERLGKQIRGEAKSASAENATAVSLNNSSVKTPRTKYFMPPLSKEDQALKGKTIKLDGTVGAIGPMGIGVVYEKNLSAGTEKEMWFDFNDALKLVGAKTLADFGEGDTIRVAYLDFVKTEKRDDKVVVLAGKKILQEMTLVRKKVPEPEAAEEPDESEEEPQV